MRNLILIAVLLFLGCTLANGQDVAELAIIRSLLGVPQTTPVSSSSNVAVPSGASLKVYIDVSGDLPERDKRVRDELIQWFSQLTGGNPSSPQALELVTEPGLAQVVLIHFTDFPTGMVEPGESNATDGLDSARLSQSGGVSSYSATVRMSMMVHTYIVVKDSNKVIILFRRKVPFVVRSTIIPGAQLTSAAAAKLRKEVDKEADKRISKANYEKDSKRSDLKMRDEFTRWMASQSSSSMSK